MSGAYRYWSRAAEEPGSDTAKVLDSGPLDDFVALLGTQVIVVKSKPTKDHPTVFFDPSDEWAEWFAKLDDKGAGTVTLTADQKTGINIESFECNFKAPWNLTFSSAADALSKAFVKSPLVGAGSPLTLVPAPGIDKTASYLYMAYVPTGSIVTTIQELFTFVGFDSKDISCFPSALQHLAVKLDASKIEGQRNLLWFDPVYNLRVVVRLQFDLESITELSDDVASTLKGFSVKSAQAVCKKDVTRDYDGDDIVPVKNGSLAFSVDCSITSVPGTLKLIASIEYTMQGVDITCMMTVDELKNTDSDEKYKSNTDALSIIISWFAGLLNVDMKDVKEFLNQENFFSNIHLRRVNILLQKDKAGKKMVVDKFSIDIEVETKFGRKENSPKPVAFLIEYNWQRSVNGLGTLVGSLWNWTDFSDERLLSPQFEAWRDLQPSQGKDVADAIDLLDLIPGEKIENVPENIPTRLTEARIELAKNSVGFQAAIETTKDSETQRSVPMPYLDMVSLRLYYAWSTPKKLDVQFGLHASLRPSSTSKQQDPAVLTGSIRYLSDSNDKSWDFQASLQDLYASTLYEFFDADSAGHVMPLIDSLSIQKLDVTYKYAAEVVKPKDGGGTASNNSGTLANTPAKRSVAKSFEIHGIITISTLELKLDFIHSGDGKWSFEATVHTKSKVSLGTIISKVLGDDELELPDFLANTEFGGEEDKLRIDVIRASGKESTGLETGDYFQFLATLHVGPVTLTFFQFHDKVWPAGTASKRLLKVSISELPKANVPLVGEMLQPFDEMYYMWIQDSTNTNIEKQPGLTRDECTMVNKLLSSISKDLPSVKEMVIKEKYEEKKRKGDNVMCSAGSHFVIIIHDSMGQRTCLLDYDFMKKTTKDGDAETGNKPATVTEAEAAGSSESAENAGGTAHAPIKKKSGPLTISNIGFKYAQKVLQVKFSATMELGPLAFELIGLSIDFRINSIKDKSISVDDVNIEGLSAAFKKPPLTIAGLIRHQKTEAMEYYAGGMIIGFIPYQFQAAGFYGEVQRAGGGGPFKSIFIFARLEGPLVTLEFAEISGVTGGFGYNSMVNMPRADQVTDFPFVATKKIDGAGGSALKTLEKITDPVDGWFAPLESSYWAAAGLKVDAFQMLAINAVVVVQFGPSIKLGIFAVAVADLPASVGSSTTKFAHIELGIAVVIDFDYGIMKAEAQLAPSSYILHPDCHLTGGFALYYWFDAPHASPDLTGNFVFTIGGYHQAFQVPPGWPNPPRLGISWSLGSNLSVTGEAYFAITPKVCMGGGRLHAAFSAGPIKAWFDTFADFLINFQPFHFIASARICIGVRFDIDFLFIHTHISCEIGAGLDLWGPPLAGRVHVNFWITSFDINFGDQHATLDKLGLFDFYKLVLSINPDSNKNKTIPDQRDNEPRPQNEAHIFLAKTGLMNENDNAKRAEGDPWIVRGGLFSFVVDCKMAVSAAKKGAQDSVEYRDNEIYAKPMQLTSALSSIMEVTIVKSDKPQDDIPDWRAKPYLKSVPAGLWSKYTSSNNPSSPSARDELLSNSGGQIPLMMGVEYMVPKTQPSPDRLPVHRIEEASVATIAAARKFPPANVPANASWAPVPPIRDPDSGKVIVKAEEWEKVRKVWAREVEGDDPDRTKQKHRVEVEQKAFVRAWADAFLWTSEKLDEVAMIPKRINMNFADLFVAVPVLTV